MCCPGKRRRVESERLQFIERHAAGEETVAEPVPEVWYQSQDWLQADWSGMRPTAREVCST